jgi:hypothetical protein
MRRAPRRRSSGQGRGYGAAEETQSRSALTRRQRLRITGAKRKQPGLAGQDWHPNQGVARNERRRFSMEQRNIGRILTHQRIAPFGEEAPDRTTRQQQYSGTIRHFAQQGTRFKAEQCGEFLGDRLHYISTAHQRQDGQADAGIQPLARTTSDSSGIDFCFEPLGSPPLGAEHGCHMIRDAFVVNAARWLQGPE